MAFKMTLWVLALTFMATLYNVVGAYNAMGAMNIQYKFKEIGLLEGMQEKIPVPAKKPSPPANELASL